MEEPFVGSAVLQVQLPRHWYNVTADLPGYTVEHRKPTSAGEGYGAESTLRPQLPLSIYRQIVSKDPFIRIPEEIREQYARWRPTPLIRATRLERWLKTPARIYYKYEGTSPSGSHKLNSALAQAYYYHRAGVKHLSTGTGAGQWGTALAMACAVYGMASTIFMVRCSYDQKPYRRVLMELSGAQVVPSPSPMTGPGRAMLDDRHDGPGSLSIASSEAIAWARQDPDRRYVAGSGENHVLLHQTVIGQEAVMQMRLIGEEPDTVVGAVGAGSNFAGLAFPFYRESLLSGRRIDLVAVEPEACPKLTRGRYTWDYHDEFGSTPMSMMYTLGHTFVPSPIHAGGLRYHGAAPVLSWMYHRGLLSAEARSQQEVFEAGVTFAQTEQIVPAPESAHAIRCVIDRAVRARESGKQTAILFSLSGHGLLDLGAYDMYLTGQLGDESSANVEISTALAKLACAD
jgi:tryptophan synthase beta chain